MTKQEQLALLQQGVEIWNIWREQHPEVSIDLREIDLVQTNLKGANLRDANLYNTRLFFANLQKADLHGAKCVAATLRYADFSQADASQADFSHADLIEAKFINTNLTNTCFRGTKLNNADLSGVDLSGADLSGADLSGANLSGANLSGVIVGWTIFGDLDLRTAKGLETIQHEGPSTIGTNTLSRSHGEIPEILLRGAGLDDILIKSVQYIAKKTVFYDNYFISYARQDQLFAKKLYESLQHEGIRCWFIPEEIDADYKAWDIFDIMICHDYKLLLVLSEHSLAHSWIKREVERVLHKETNEKSIILYPLRVDKAILTYKEVWAKEMKESRHINDFEGWIDGQQYKKSFYRLLDILSINRRKV